MSSLNVLIVFVGGGLGAASRYLTGLAFLQRFGPGFPFGTLTINVSGCFLIGVIAEMAQTRAFGIGSSMRLFLVVGFLGGFTTFSSFAYETVTLTAGALSASAIIYILVSVGGGITAAFAGIVLARLTI